MNVSLAVSNKLFLMALTVILLAASARSEFGETGWGGYKKIQPARFRGAAVTATGNSEVASALFNPAMLMDIEASAVNINSELGVVQDNFNSVLCALKYPKFALAAGAAAYNAGKEELNWIENGALVTREVFVQRDLMGLLAGAFSISRNLNVGAAFKYATSELAETSTAVSMAADAGAVYTPLNNLSVSVSALNIGQSTKFIEKADQLPLTGYVSAGYRLKQGENYLLPSAGAAYYVNEKQYVPEAGLEYGHGNYSVNAGYRMGIEELNIQAGFRARIKQFDIGYSYLPGVFLGPTHRLSLSFAFGRSYKKNTRKDTEILYNHKPLFSPTKRNYKYK